MGKKLSDTKRIETSECIIASISANGVMSISENPTIHPDYQTAAIEAERLVRNGVGNTGKKFVVLQSRGTVMASGVVWQ